VFSDHEAMLDYSDAAARRSASDHADVLHRALASRAPATGAACWLLLDRGPLSLNEASDPLLADLLSRGDLRMVNPPRNDVPAGLAPALLRLNSEVAQDSETIGQSLGLAGHELSSGQLAQAGGRVVAAWLEGSDGADDDPQPLQRHFSEFMFFLRPDGRVQWLRWYDPAVLWALWPCLRAEQRAVLLGPIRRYWLFAPNAALLALDAPTTTSIVLEHGTSAALRLALTPEQWNQIDAISALNLAFVQANASAFTDAALEQARQAGMAALARAQRVGLHDVRDLALYAHVAITRHPAFDEHPDVAQRLQSLKPGDYFSASIDGLTDADWTRICRELNERRGKPLTQEREPAQ
jgi:hypothetical protein